MLLTAKKRATKGRSWRAALLLAAVGIAGIASPAAGSLPRARPCALTSTYAETRVMASSFLVEKQHQENRGLSADLVVGVCDDPMGLVDGPSMYQFAGYSPTNFSDPMGLCTGALQRTKACQAITGFIESQVLGVDEQRAADHASAQRYLAAFQRTHGRAPSGGELVFTDEASGRYLTGDGRWASMSGEIRADHAEFIGGGIAYGAAKAAVSAAVVGGTTRQVATAAVISVADDLAGEVVGVNPSVAKGLVPRAAANLDPARTFPVSRRVPNAGGVIRSFVTEQDQTFYRVFSGESQTGGFLVKAMPSSRAQAIEGLALQPGNQAQFIQEVLVPAGTRLQRSRTVPAFGRRGGLEQFELLGKIPAESFGPGVLFE